jgi:predicted deacylase
VNRKIFCTSKLLYGCLSAAFILNSDIQAQENALPKDLLVISPVTDRPVAVAPIKANREVQTLPTAVNVNLNDVVTEPEEGLLAESLLPNKAQGVSSDTGTSLERASLKAEREIKKLPTAANVDLKDVVIALETIQPHVIQPHVIQPHVIQLEEVMPVDNLLPQAVVVPENNLQQVNDQTLSDKKVFLEQPIVNEEQLAIEEQAAIEQQNTVEEQIAVDGQNAKELIAIADKEEAPETKSKFILGMEVPANTATRLTWTPENKAGGLAERTPVLVVNGKSPGKTLCLTAAMHGDELNGIEMIRRIMYQLDADKLAGTVIGVPVVNLMGFRRNSRYLPDRRDLNRYFPGNTRGSSASRIAHSFFTKIILHCDLLIDIHTGSLNRTNLTQLRADLSNPEVVSMAKSFGSVPILNSRGNPRSLRAAAVRAGIPTVTIEAGEPMRMQRKVVSKGTKAIKTFMATMNMVGRSPRKSSRSAPVYYKSSWVRTNQSGIFFSNVPLGERVIVGEVLGTVTDPITNRRSEIQSSHRGRILGMALDQVVLPGFAIYHIGIQTQEALLMDERQLAEAKSKEKNLAADLQPSDDGSINPDQVETPLQDVLDDDE